MQVIDAQVTFDTLKKMFMQLYKFMHITDWRLIYAKNAIKSVSPVAR